MMNPCFHHGDNFRGRNTKGTRKYQHGFQRRLSQSTLKHRDVGAIQTSIESNDFLSFTRAGAEFPKNVTKHLFDCRPLSHAVEGCGFGPLSSSDSCLHFGYS